MKLADQLRAAIYPISSPRRAAAIDEMLSKIDAMETKFAKAAAELVPTTAVVVDLECSGCKQIMHVDEDVYCERCIEVANIDFTKLLSAIDPVLGKKVEDGDANRDVVIASALNVLTEERRKRAPTPQPTPSGVPAVGETWFSNGISGPCRILDVGANGYVVFQHGLSDPGSMAIAKFLMHYYRSASTKTGLYRKYTVHRIDGTDRHGGKHSGCEYFVLDWQHDKFMGAAMRAYADACAGELPELAKDIRENLEKMMGK